MSTLLTVYSEEYQTVGQAILSPAVLSRKYPARIRAEFGIDTLARLSYHLFEQISVD
jgi:hypothetical protein